MVLDFAFVASWKLNQLFSDDSLRLHDFQRHITIAYLGFSNPRNPSDRKLGIQQANGYFLKLNKENVIVRNPENRQSRSHLKLCAAKPTTICTKRKR
ncbi:hypothetical protein AVEN_58599-1 [Araneus ventricosus]|uniref:Uncharacterized protein n=1 Tax=Araneus ventricosus TaxID=182803 RepID=A0A4Y2N5L3_ARAVE|nr:hypothetical protein AVEN_58599-1 [Araneus ventricosus]